MAASTLGNEAALPTVSGTMFDLLALRMRCEAGAAVIIEDSALCDCRRCRDGRRGAKGDLTVPMLRARTSAQHFRNGCAPVGFTSTRTELTVSGAAGMRE